MAARRVCVIVDGVDYLHGTRAPLLGEVELAGAPDAATAQAAVEEVLARQTGKDARLRAGWAAARLVSPDGQAWDGPAFLFALEAREAGQIVVTPSGEDSAPWDDPPGPGEFS